MPKTCSLIAFWDDEANQTLPVLNVRDADFQDAADAAAAAGGNCVLLADCRGAGDSQRCDAGLSVAEARAGRPAGTIQIVASIDSAAALMQVGGLGDRSTRLAGLTWNRPAFCVNIGCAPESAVAVQARSSVVIAARAFGVPAYDSHEMADDAGALGFDGLCVVEEVDA